MVESYEAEFFLDPICPWCWITSRWVVEVQAERGLTVGWRFIALKVLNEANSDDYATSRKASHLAGFKALRVLDAVRAEHGNTDAGNRAVGALYTALGTEIHNNDRADELVADAQKFLAGVLTSVGLDPGLAKHADDESHDAPLRAETEAALARTGPNVGTPIITFQPGTGAERSFFGPVLPSIPRGAAATALWDAVVTLANSDVAELKRSLRGAPSFD